MTHTPGPWNVGPRGAAVYTPDGMRLAALDARKETLGQRADNARLMAAAPDLLVACQRADALLGELVRHLDGLRAVHAGNVLETVRAAIARATPPAP